MASAGLGRRAVLTAAALAGVSALTGCGSGGLWDFEQAPDFTRPRPVASECFADPTAVALAEAVQAGDLGRLRELAGQRADLAVRGLDGVSLWDWGLRYRRWDSIRGLAELDLDLELPGYFDQPPTHTAPDAGDPESTALTLLLDLGADVDSRSGAAEEPLLFVPVAIGHPAFTLLVDRGADVRATNGFGRTVLFATCTVNSFDFALQMLQKGVDPTHTDQSGDTFQPRLFSAPEEVLSVPARQGRAAIVAWLQQHQIPVER